MEIAHPVAAALSIPTFRLYVSDDLAGVQVGGAVKNVLAIACGIVAGRKLGESARAALIARSFAELNRIGGVLGARGETLGGLSGLGDLVLSCSSAQSRNFRLGQAMGEGRSPGEILGSQRGTSEGAYTASVVDTIATKHAIEVPIISAVRAILDGDYTIDEAIEQLDRASGCHGSNAGYKLEYRSHYLLGTIQLASFRNNSPEIVNLAQAESAFLNAARYARMDEPMEAGRAFLAAGWAA